MRVVCTLFRISLQEFWKTCWFSTMLRFVKKELTSFSIIPTVFFRQMVSPSGILLVQINDIICEYLTHNIRIP